MSTIRLEPVGEQPHFIAYFDRPGRIEVSTASNGILIAHLYDGTTVDLDQEPLGAYSSDVGNEAWEA